MDETDEEEEGIAEKQNRKIKKVKMYMKIWVKSAFGRIKEIGRAEDTDC